MQATIAQTVSLATFGNAYLAGAPEAYPADFYPRNSTFRFCKAVRFMDLQREAGGGPESPFAADPDAFFQRLKAEGFLGLRVFHAPSQGSAVPDRMTVGFMGGGGRWLLEAIGPKTSDLWQARWSLGNQNDPEQKIWDVAYGRVAAGVRTANVSAGQLEPLKARLAGNLLSMAAFARRQKLDGFAASFESASVRLDAAEPFEGLYHPDIAPKSLLSQTACQLLSAAQAAWVFGGMGSWNDLRFEGKDQKTYDKLSEELYQLLNAAIVQATNTAYRGRAARQWWRAKS
jgi:hypothetical protein